MDITIDALKYYEMLKDAGVPEKQAKVQADVMRLQSQAQAAAFNNLAKELDEKSRKELAAKGDVHDLRIEIEKLRSEMQKTKYDLLKWQTGIGFLIISVIAKGFGWLGF